MITSNSAQFLNNSIINNFWRIIIMDVREIFDKPPRTYDRSPQICPAGRHPISNGSVAERLRSYILEDKIAALKREKNIPEKEPPAKYKLPYLENKRHHGIFVESYRLFIPPIKNRYQTVVNDLKETSYHSYWTKNLGASKDSCGNLPAHINPKEFTFGIKSKKETAADLLNPRKKHGQVLDEFVKGHEFYKKSHNWYFVGEKNDYDYKSPPFNPNKRYGEKTLYDQRGIWLKDIMNAKKTLDKYTVANYIQSGCQTENAPKLGQCQTPNHIARQQPEDFCYGSNPVVSESMATLLTENTKAETKYEIEDYMSFLNTLRNRLKKRFNKLLISFDDLYNHLKYYDKEHTGWIPYEIAIEICICHRVNFDKETMKKVLTLLSIYKDDKVNFKDFLSVLNWQGDFPKIGPVYHNKPEKYYYGTTYRKMLKEMSIKEDQPTAGTPSIRYDLPEFIPAEMCAATDLSSYGGETLAATIMYPSVYESYGLSHRDLFFPRPKREIFEIFMRVGYIFDEDEFEQIWREAVEVDKSEMVCADTFKNLLHKHEIPFDMQPGIIYEPEERQCYVQDKTRIY